MALNLIAIQAAETVEPAFNPNTVLVSHFTFQRPSDWQWVDTRDDIKNVKQSVIFRVGNSNADPAGEAHIAHFVSTNTAGDPASVATRWSGAFIGAPEAARFGEPLKLGKNRVYLLDYEGTVRPEFGKKTAPAYKNFSFCGAIIEDPEGNIVIRMLGPTPMIRKAKPEFMKMIVDALGDG